MKTFLGEYLPIILTFVSGGFFWEFARHMFFIERKSKISQTDEEDPWGIVDKGL